MGWVLKTRYFFLFHDIRFFISILFLNLRIFSYMFSFLYFKIYFYSAQFLLGTDGQTFWVLRLPHGDGDGHEAHSHLRECLCRPQHRQSLRGGGSWQCLFWGLICVLFLSLIIVTCVLCMRGIPLKNTAILFLSGGIQCGRCPLLFPCRCRALWRPCMVYDACASLTTLRTQINLRHSFAIL
jgi:hypothetical protein